MKKYLFAIVCILSFAGLKAQTFTSGHITAVVTDTMTHDSTICTSTYYYWYVVTIDSSYTGETVNLVDTLDGSLIGSYVNTTGASPWTFSSPEYGIGHYDWTLSGGYAYFDGPTVKVTAGTDTLRYITSHDSLLVINPCLYSTVSGAMYIDNNGNCTFDSGDVGIEALNVNISENLSSSAGSLGWWCGGTVSTGGTYTYGVQQSWMVNYTVSIPAYYAFIFPASPCFTTSYTFTTLPQTGVDFPLMCSSNVDVQCAALAPVSVRLHTPFYMQPYVSNTGCDTVSGQLTLVMDSRVIYDSSLSIYPADTVRGDTLIWNYSGLSDLSGGAYWNSFLSDIYLSLDSTVAVGDTLCFRAYTNIPATDINPANNDYTICLPVVYSYDPNLKEVSPKGTGPQGYIPAGTDTLSYSLHFQNTGSASAENISIIDTLDSHINASSLKILGTSHSMTPQWLAPGVVEFSYNEINLPDSGTNEAASQGEVRFSVALNPGLAPGTQIKNTGYIYFDLNPPVVTNTTLNTISLVTKTEQVIANVPVKIYPNPATDNIVVEHLAGGELDIMNLNGVVVMQQTIANDKTTIDVSRLASGVYIIKTINNATTNTVKFIKY